MIQGDLHQRINDTGVTRLHAHRAEMIRLEDIVPGFRILRLLPPKISHRRLRIGDPGVDLYFFISGVNTDQPALFHGHHLGRPRVLFRHRRMPALCAQ